MVECRGLTGQQKGGRGRAGEDMEGEGAEGDGRDVARISCTEEGGLMRAGKPQRHGSERAPRKPASRSRAAVWVYL